MDCTDICIRNWYIETVLLYCKPMWIYRINVSETVSQSQPCAWILSQAADGFSAFNVAHLSFLAQWQSASVSEVVLKNKGYWLAWTHQKRMA